MDSPRRRDLSALAWRSLAEQIEIEIKEWQTVVNALDWLLRKNPQDEESQLKLNAALATLEQLKARLKKLRTPAD